MRWAPAPPQVWKTPAQQPGKELPKLTSSAQAQTGCLGGPGAAPEALLPRVGTFVPCGQAVRLAGWESAMPA